MIKNANREKGIATIAIILIVIVGLGIIGGGIAYFIKSKNSQEEKAENFGPEREQARVFQYEDLPKGTIEDLIIGERVAVSGAENQDGSITANLIFIGMPEQEFFQRDRNQETQRDLGGEGERPQMPEDIDFEERRARMQELRDSSQVPLMEGRIGVVRGGTAFVRGEIIDKDEISITIEIEEGGSKLVFYSKDIQIIKKEE